MRKIINEFDVYNFDELSEQAKENAINAIVNKFDFAFSSDYKNSLTAFADALDISVYDWSVGAFSPSYYNYSVNNDYVGEIDNGLRLAKWINNNILHKVQKGKYYSTGGKYIDGKYTYKHRYSKVIEGDYMPTGFCADYDIFSNVIDCAKHLATFETFGDLVDACLDRFFAAWRADMEYQYTEEGARELADCNELEFLADGSIYR